MMQDSAGAPELVIRHLRLPLVYLSANWPLRVACISPDANNVAVAGTRGLAVCNVFTWRWRLFGDVVQERSFRCTCVRWLGGHVVACVKELGVKEASWALHVYPAWHLDKGSRVGRLELD